MLFYNDNHEKFFNEKKESLQMLNDPYRQSLVYLLSMLDSTRFYFNQIYNEITGDINPNVLTESWQTSGTITTIRLAFNLYNGFTGEESKVDVVNNYTVENIFCTSELAPYFWEAIKIRFEIKNCLQYLMK